MKILKFEIKIFDLGIFGHEFGNTIVITEISALEFVYLLIFAQEQKCINLGQKDVFWE